ncbi:MAG TPA: hypothetical protein PLQ56_12235 [Aggregatilineales bacterium]|nr:hypothetical protein [Aggregatilineales bacterium]
MTVTTAWLNSEKTIILYDFEGEWTWTEYHAAVDQSHIMLRTVPHTVDFIVNMAYSRHMPPNAYLNIIDAARRRPENWGISAVVVGPHMTFMRRFRARLGRLLPGLGRHYVFVTTMEAARTLIRREAAKRVAGG